MADNSEWEDYELEIIQTLATYLGLEILGFKPRVINLSIRFKNFPPLPDLDVELSRNNGGFAQIAVLSGLLRGSREQKEAILAKVKPAGFWEKSLDRYLFDLMAFEFNRVGRIDIEIIQSKIPDRANAYFGEPPSDRTLFGDYYNWALVLELQPTWDQVVKAIELLNRRTQGKLKR